MHSVGPQYFHHLRGVHAADPHLLRNEDQLVTGLRANGKSFCSASPRIRYMQSLAEDDEIDFEGAQRH